MKRLRNDGSRQQAPIHWCDCGEDSEHVLVDHATVTGRMCHDCFGRYLAVNVPDSRVGAYYTPETIANPAASSGTFLADAVAVINPPYEVRP